MGWFLGGVFCLISAGAVIVMGLKKDERERQRRKPDTEEGT